MAEEQKGQYLSTIARMVLGAKGHSTCAEAGLYDESTGIEHSISSSMRFFRNQDLHIVGLVSNLDSEEGVQSLRIYEIGTNPNYDNSFLPDALPPELLVFEKTEGLIERYLPGDWEKKLECLLQIAEQ
jgi:hypothetical protein